ncbi:MAG: TonB-dependent receptor, partial [Actinomycetota bacterium]
MLHKNIAFAVALASCGGAQAATDADLAAIRAQIDDMKKSYEQRIAALEAKLAAAEAAKSAGSAPAPAPAAPMPAGSATAFNPEVSVILNGTYASTSRSPDTYRLRGFIPSGGEISPPKRSFSLGESELALAANVDPMFRGVALFSMSPDGGVNTEEAYVETLALPEGLKLKAGRFLSGIGYLNAQHPHAWDFVDAPLIYKAFYGSRLGNDGVQLKWLAPTPIYLEVGAEMARGGGFPGNERDRNGNGLGALFAHVGDDVGISHSWQAGVSYVSTRPNGRQFSDIDAAGTVNAVGSLAGSSNTVGADFVWKWAPNGDPTYRSFKFQAEYMQRRESGSLTYDDTPIAAPAGAGLVGAASDTYRRRQSGWYAQGVWQFARGWRVGYRHDALDSGTANVGTTLALADAAGLQRYSPRRDTLM